MPVPRMNSLSALRSLRHRRNKFSCN